MRDHCSLQDVTLHLSVFEFGVVVFDVILSASDKVGEPLLVVRMKVGCKNFGERVGIGAVPKVFSDIYY